MHLVALFTLAAALAQAGPITIAELGGFLHAGGSLQTQLTNTSPEYFSTLDGDNLGSFGWSFTNTTGSTLTDLLFFVFLDADIDRVTGSYFDEYGLFVNLDLPPGSPAGAIAATSWEIDEPGFVFGDIYNNLLAGVLDNTNAIPSGNEDDVSLALGFALGDLASGQTATLFALVSLTDIGGLSHTDPATPYTFYFNAHATTDAGPPSNVPEPGTFLSFASALLAIGLLRGRASR